MFSGAQGQQKVFISCGAGWGEGQPGGGAEAGNPVWPLGALPSTSRLWLPPHTLVAPLALQTAVLHPATRQLVQREGLRRGSSSAVPPGTSEASSRLCSASRPQPLLPVCLECAPDCSSAPLPTWHPSKTGQPLGFCVVSCVT